MFASLKLAFMARIETSRSVGCDGARDLQSAMRNFGPATSIAWPYAVTQRAYGRTQERGEVVRSSSIELNWYETWLLMYT